MINCVGIFFKRKITFPLTHMHHKLKDSFLIWKLDCAMPYGKKIYLVIYERSIY